MVLTLAYVLSFIDRQTLTLLVAPIQADLDLSDTQISLLIGAAFAICYVTFGLPLGWLVDRAPRKWIASGGILMWSIATAACGMAQTYAHLFAARMLVGLGEASLTPATYSLLSDSFPPARLVRAIGIYMSGAIIGISLAYALGGQLAAWVAGNNSLMLPFVGIVRSWHAVFFMLLIPGLIIAALAAFIREPGRQKIRKIDETPLLPFLKLRLLPFGLVFLAMGAQSVIVYANLTWMPTLLGRRFGWQPGEIGLALGAVFLTAGLGGNALGAWLGSRFLGQGRPVAFIGLCIATSTMLVLVGTMTPLVSTPTFVLALLVPTICLTSIPTAIVPTAVQMATPSMFRGRISALYLFATQMFGLMLGPTLVALFTDYVFVDRQAIAWSQAATVAMAAVLSLGCFTAARRPFARLLDADRVTA